MRKYDAYGRQGIMNQNGTVSYCPSDYGNFVGFQGRYHDWETGLIFYRTRYMDTALGRFINRMPWFGMNGMNLSNYSMISMDRAWREEFKGVLAKALGSYIQNRYNLYDFERSHPSDGIEPFSDDPPHRPEPAPPGPRPTGTYSTQGSPDAVTVNPPDPYAPVQITDFAGRWEGLKVMGSMFGAPIVVAGAIEGGVGAVGVGSAIAGSQAVTSAATAIAGYFNVSVGTIMGLYARDPEFINQMIEGIPGIFHAPDAPPLPGSNFIPGVMALYDAINELKERMEKDKENAEAYKELIEKLEHEIERQEHHGKKNCP